MSLPGNGIFVVQGEMAMLVTAMRRSTRWGSHSFPNEEYDVLMRTFQDLKSILNHVEDLRLLDPSTYLSPFLEVIRSKETTGPVTSLALSAIHKFLSYGLIDPTHPSVPATVEDIADAVTHARFVGTDHSSDGVVLMKILQVLRTLMLSPEGAMLTDESVCEIMLSCFRICFETRLTELLRRNAEQCLRDMTQLIFMRLPQFSSDEDDTFTPAPLSLKKRDKPSKRRLASIHNTNSLDRKSPVEQPSAVLAEVEQNPDANKVEALRNSQDKNLINEAEITIEPVEPLKTTNKHGRHSSMDLANQNPITQLLEKCVEQTEPQETAEQQAVEEKEVVEASPTLEPEAQPEDLDKPQEYVNHRGIRFTQEEGGSPQPYSLVCVRELFRFLISLCNPLDPQNTSAMVHLGLSLVGTALEVSADQVHKYRSLLHLVRDPLCKHLLSLLSTERISIFALDLQVTFLLFEALRFHLKFQMEAFFKKIVEIISTDTTKAIYELKEIHHLALESLAQMFRIPGLCTELYLNYDCDVYCTNVFEELTKLLSKNVVSSTAYNIHTLSLEALMTIIEAIELAGIGQVKDSENENETEIAAIEGGKETKFGRCGHISLELGGMDESINSNHVTHDISQYLNTGVIGRHKTTTDLPTEAELDNIRNMKKWVQQGTELFNQKPEKGIDYLQEHGVLTSPLDPHEVAMFLRENPDLDKKMIGEYICKRSARSDDDEDCHSVLGAFASSFDFTGLRIDQALRLYLETFRLPGEAPLIFLVMERFAERWHTTNGEPFANTDAAFRLAYAVIMLNVDQHNQNAKKLSTPMTMEGFVRNLRGCNGSGDFDQPMLEAMFQAIKSEEMVMPAERVGPVRDAYLWRVLQRRGLTPAGKYRAAPPHHPHHARLFAHACPPAVTALSAAFERATPPTTSEIECNNLRDSTALIALNGLERCAALISRLPPIEITLDTLLLTLCKFTGLLAPQHANYIAIGVTLGQSVKAQLALRRACAVAARHADCIRDAWRHLLEIVKTLYIGRLLPKSLVEAEDYLSSTGTVSLIRDSSRGSEAGLLSSIYSYIALGETGIRAPTPHERALTDAAAECVASCNLPGLLITETKFLRLESLQELVRAMVSAGAPPDADSIQLNPQLEDITIFFLELLGQTLIQNRDRLLTVWDEAGPHLHRCVTWSAALSGPNTAGPLPRALTALLRTSARLMRCATCVPVVLRQLQGLLQLPYRLFHKQADVISCGLYELVKTSAQNVHSTAEWNVVLSLVCAAGAGAWPSDANTATNTTSSRSEGSGDESDRRPTSVSSESELSHSPQTQGWILVKNETNSSTSKAFDMEVVMMRPPSGAALARCCEALALIIRDVAHVTPYNCRAAVSAVRIFARATHRAGKRTKSRSGRSSRASSGRRAHAQTDSSESDADTRDHRHLVSVQLLDLMHTLHSRTAQIYKWWKDEAEGQSGEDYDLWEVAWKPLLQGIAQFCTDKRKQVANSAIAYLQRALLVPGLSAMGGSGWEACFQSVLFPLLEQLPRRADTAARANTIMCKVFLQHLSALSPRATFGALWIKVVDVQKTLIASSSDDPLTEAALESLKNMILVMDSVRIFSSGDGYNDLWYITWEKIGEFLPTLKDELFPQVQDNARPPSSLPSHMQPTLPSSLPTLFPVGTNSTLLPYQPITSLAHSPVNLCQTPPLLSTTLVAPTPVTGMVPIRNPLYDQAGLTSSVLLQPLNEMISTSIGISIQSQMPVLYPQSNLANSQQTLELKSTEISSLQQSPMHPAVNLHQTALPMHQTALTNDTAPSLQQIAQPLQQMSPTLQQMTPTLQQMAPTLQQIAPKVPQASPTVQQSPPTLEQMAPPLQQIAPPLQQSAPPLQQMVPTLQQMAPTLQEMAPTLQEMAPTIQQSDTTSHDIESTLPQPINNQTSHKNTILEIINPIIDNKIEHSEIYADYLTNPYNEYTDITKEATIYDPEKKQIDSTSITNPLLAVLEKQKSLSEQTTPMHKNKSQFGSSDNIRQESSIFNFSSYFGSNELGGSEVFDTLMSSQEG